MEMYMTNILTSAEMDELSDDELLALYKEYSARAIIQKNIEQAIKILVNSLYGYLGSPYSRFYNKYLAEAITLTGQAIIRKSADYVNEDLDKITGFKKDRIVAIDTDSLVFSSKIMVNNKEISIGDYYNSVSDENMVDSRKEIKSVTNGDVSLSFNGTTLENKSISYVMRHKVNKKMYRIKVGNDFVDVTEDHSVMVIDECGKLISIKPADLNNQKHKIVRIVNG